MFLHNKLTQVVKICVSFCMHMIGISVTGLELCFSWFHSVIQRSLWDEDGYLLGLWVITSCSLVDPDQHLRGK
jgi:hypothetical protein